MPETWWIQPTREAFVQAAQEQADRLRREDNKITGTLLGSWSDVRMAKKQRDDRAEQERAECSESPAS